MVVGGMLEVSREQGEGDKEDNKIGTTKNKERKNGPLQVRRKGLTRNQPCLHLDLGLSVCGAVGK